MVLYLLLLKVSITLPDQEPNPPGVQSFAPLGAVADTFVTPVGTTSAQCLHSGGTMSQPAGCLDAASDEVTGAVYRGKERIIEHPRYEGHTSYRLYLIGTQYFR